MKSRECENCGASLEKNSLQCPYCGTWYEGNKRGISVPDRQNKNISLLTLPKGVGEFGISKKQFIITGITIALILYVLGWFFEDLQYWLNETAMLIWVGILPVWVFSIALLCRVKWEITLYALGISLAIFLIHMGVIWAIRGSLWDDHVGIAALVGSSWFAGWLLGRLAHRMIRWRNSRVK